MIIEYLEFRNFINLPIFIITKKELLKCQKKLGLNCS